MGGGQIKILELAPLGEDHAGGFYAVGHWPTSEFLTALLAAHPEVDPKLLGDPWQGHGRWCEDVPGAEGEPVFGGCDPEAYRDAWPVTLMAYYKDREHLFRSPGTGPLNPV